MTITEMDGAINKMRGVYPFDSKTTQIWLSADPMRTIDNRRADTVEILTVSPDNVRIQMAYQIPRKENE